VLVEIVGTVHGRAIASGLHIILRPRHHVKPRLQVHVVAVISFGVRHRQPPSRQVVVLCPVTQVSHTAAAWARIVAHLRVALSLPRRLIIAMARRTPRHFDLW